MFFLTVVYSVQSLVCWAYLDPKEFQEHISNGQYGIEIYEYSLLIEKLKVVHALSLGSVAFFVLLAARKFKMLNEKHYAQLLLAAVLITVLYLLPLVYLCYQAFSLAGKVYYDGSDFAFKEQSDFAVFEIRVRRMTDWLYMMIKRSDLGTIGLIISGLIHL